MSIEKDSKSIYNNGYVKGHNDGWRGAVKAYGFGKPDNEVINKLDKKYKEGYNDCSEELHSIFGERELEIKKDSYQEGYAQAYSEIHAPTTERERQLQEKAWDEGYLQGEADMLEAVNELSSQQADDWNGQHNPNKETQEAVQEVLDKNSRKHSHYFKDTSKFDEIDTYLLARIWGIEDKNGAYFHAFKKVLDAGKRGNKGKLKDIGEAIDSLKRYIEVEEMFEGYKHG